MLILWYITRNQKDSFPQNSLCLFYTALLRINIPDRIRRVWESLGLDIVLAEQGANKSRGDIPRGRGEGTERLLKSVGSRAALQFTIDILI